MKKCKEKHRVYLLPASASLLCASRTYPRSFYRDPYLFSPRTLSFQCSVGPQRRCSIILCYSVNSAGREETRTLVFPPNQKLCCGAEKGARVLDRSRASYYSSSKKVGGLIA